MQKHWLMLVLICCTMSVTAQKKHRFINGMYFQWGYNKEWYTNSNIHFKLGNGDRFTLHHAKAHDKPDIDAVLKKPVEISIPQYNYRIGFYLNRKKSRALEINFDHAKYVVTDNQRVRVTGTIGGQQVDTDITLTPHNFLHLEHTDGANWLHINYVQQHTLVKKHDQTSPFITVIWKAGAGINIPRTDFTWKGERFNNKFHVAGYNFGIEGGARLYVSKKLFLEFTGKTGFVKYVNALANTNSMKNSYVKHSFGYFELLGLIGYDFMF